MNQGIIIKGIGSFYYIMDDATGEIIQCRLKGIFRSQKIVPMVGDCVLYDNDDLGDGIVTKILPRKSTLSRPMVANATQGVIVCALKSPDISTILLDKMLINNAASGLNSVICFNKSDLADASEKELLQLMYEKCGARLIFTSAVDKTGLLELSSLMKDRISVFSGVSGAGKSSLLKEFIINSDIEIGAISKKSNRGKHTTRHSELMILPGGGYIMDTPGFSDLELQLEPNTLWKYYPEFYPFSDCKYTDCLHLHEPGCHVKDAVERKEIPSERYNNYKKIYEETNKNFHKY